MSAPSNSTPDSSTKARPSFRHSKTLPALKRALSINGVQKPLAGLCNSSSNSLRRVSSFCRRQSCHAPTPNHTPSMECAPTFTTPDYTRWSIPWHTDSVSPLTRPLAKRSWTTPNSMWGLRLTTKVPGACERPRRCSVSSVSSASTSASASTSTPSTSTSSRRRRRSSSISTTSISSNEEKMPLRAYFPVCSLAVFGFFSSVVGMLVLRLLPNAFPEKPTRKLLRRPHQRKTILSGDHSPKVQRTSHLSRSALADLSDALMESKPSQAPISTTFDPKTFRGPDVALFVDPTSDALPLPKGPALEVRPPVVTRRRSRWSAVLTTVREEKERPGIVPRLVKSHSSDGVVALHLPPRVKQIRFEI